MKMIRRKFSQMKKILYVLIGFSFILICLSCTSKDNTVNKQIAEKLNTVISDFFTKYDLPGLAVGVVAENKTFYTKGFGVENIKTKKPITPETIFHMASDSKPFVAAAIMQLAERKNLDLNAPVVTYLPYFMLKDERYQIITIRQMLTHSSGMPDESNYGFRNPQFDKRALERYVRSISDKQLIFEPDEKYSYSMLHLRSWEML